MVAVPEAVLGFNLDQKKWPKDLSELKRWMEDSGMDVNFLSSCRDLLITENASGKEAILRFKIRKPNFSSDVEMILPNPSGNSPSK
jgi:hypothetical protein